MSPLPHSDSVSSPLRSIVRRGITVLVAAGIGLAGLATFTASANSVSTAFADQSPLGISSIGSSTTAKATTAADLVAARDAVLDADADKITSAQESAALTARSNNLTEGTDAITEEINRLKNLDNFKWPTAGSVSSVYGMRMHPILHIMRMHDGDDIGGKCGQPIWAAQSGVVIKAAMGYNGGSGNNVRIDHGKINGVDVQTGYLHMKKYIVKVGQKVSQGEVIGYVGDTGLSTACHLHFSAYKNGSGTDPMQYIGWNSEAKGAKKSN